MSINTLPYILQRKCKDKTGIRVTEKYLESFWNETPRPPPDSEETYNQLVQDFLSKDLALTSEPVIPQDFGKNVIDTFPLGHLRQGGGVILQIQDTMDIRYSALSVLNNLTNAAPVRQVYVERNDESEVSLSRGMLRWTLTDGYNQIQAMEMETIPDLSLITPLGCKILIKSCPVRRGMLLLTRDNVKVLGGQVPELFGGNMLKELENRLRESVGLEPATGSTGRLAPLTNNHVNVIPHVEEDSFFDDDDFDYAQLESLAVNHAGHGDTEMNEVYSNSNALEEEPRYVSNPQHDLLKNIPSDSDSDAFEDAKDIIQSAIQPQTSSSTRSTGSSLSLSKKKRLISPEPENQARKQTSLGKQRDTTTVTSVRSMETVDLTLDDGDISTQAELEEISWVDASVWDDLSEAVREREGSDDGTYVDNQGKTHITFTKLQQTLEDMENNNYCSNLPDVVIVRLKCVMFGKLVTSNRLYSLVLHFDDPDQETGRPVQIIFSNDVLTKLLNARRQDVVNVNAAGGQKAVLRQIFKPFDKKVRNVTADIEVDLSITQKSSNSSLIPLGIGYNDLPTNPIG